MKAAAAVPRIHTGWLSVSAFSGMAGFGIAMAILGAILPLISQRLHFNLAQAGDLFLVMNATMLVGTFVLGPLLDRFGIKLTFIIAPLLEAVALVLIANAQSFEGLRVAVFFLAMGGGALNQATNTLIADLHADERRKSSALNLLGVFFGFGALSIPFSIGSLLGVFGLANILFAAAAVVSATTLVSLALTFPLPRQSAGVPLSEVLRLSRQPLILTLAILLFFESGNEWVLGGYITTYLTRSLGATMSAASWMLALYWSALMIGRTVLSLVLLHVSGHALILASAAGVAASVGLLVAAPSLPLAGCAIVLLGLSLAAIYPTTLGFAGARYPSHSGTVFGILIGISLTGGMSLPWLAGRISQSDGVGAGLSIAIAGAAAVFALQVLAGRIMRRQSHAH
jgi:FHS family glucose/mannose:H+ symporter-like MFS transporter